MDTPEYPPSWNYERFDNFHDILSTRTKEILVDLKSKKIDIKQHVTDTRDIHSRMFAGLTYSGFEHFAGHYRGADFPWLKDYIARVPSDSRVGVPPGQVLRRMNELRQQIAATFQGLDAAFALPNSQLPPEDKFAYAVIAGCKIFEMFLTIHPYANGNGHIARFCLVAIMGRYGYWCKRLTIHPRPNELFTGKSISAYRDKDFGNLEDIVRTCFKS